MCGTSSRVSPTASDRLRSNVAMSSAARAFGANASDQSDRHDVIAHVFLILSSAHQTSMVGRRNPYRRNDDVIRSLLALPLGASQHDMLDPTKPASTWDTSWCALRDAAGLAGANDSYAHAALL